MDKVYNKDDMSTIEKVNGTGKIEKITCRRYASNEIDNMNFERKETSELYERYEGRLLSIRERIHIIRATNR